MMYVATCPLRVSLFGGSTDNPYFVEKYGRGSVISFTSNLKTYVTISQDKLGYNKQEGKYIINYSRREEVSKISDIKNEVVRIVLQNFDMPPVQVTLTSDAYSQGSGLASSSSYTISLIKACCLFLSKDITDSDACKLAYELERMYNPYCGYQDPYGCGIGGFKRIDFMGDDDVTYQFLSTDIFDNYDTHLVFTGITRNSKKILKGIVNFGNVETRQIMCPRVDVFALEANRKFTEIVENLIDKGFSRVPVYNDNLDKIEGVLYVKDLLPHLEKDDFNWKSLLRKPLFIPENKRLTFGQMSQKLKFKNDHRAKAFKNIKKFF